MKFLCWLCIVALSVVLTCSKDQQELGSEAVTRPIRSWRTRSLKSISVENSSAPTEFIFYRIIGNDLPPRHSELQSVVNLKFILENEPPLPGCTKRFILNKILDPKKERSLISLLQAHNASFFRLPFDTNQYLSQKTKMDRIQYVVGPNIVRNIALLEGKQRGHTWILPWDGNCFVTPSAWRNIVRATILQPRFKYFQVSMIRLQLPNEVLLEPDWPDRMPTQREEPQIMFHSSARVEFDTRYGYSARSKLYLVDRLITMGLCGQLDYVIRLFSGVPEAETETSAGLRHHLRLKAMDLLYERLQALSGAAPLGGNGSTLTQARTQAQARPQAPGPPQGQGQGQGHGQGKSQPAQARPQGQAQGQVKAQGQGTAPVTKAQGKVTNGGAPLEPASVPAGQLKLGR